MRRVCNLPCRCFAKGMQSASWGIAAICNAAVLPAARQSKHLLYCMYKRAMHNYTARPQRLALATFMWMQRMIRMQPSCGYNLHVDVKKPSASGACNLPAVGEQAVLTVLTSAALHYASGACSLHVIHVESTLARSVACVWRLQPSCGEHACSVGRPSLCVWRLA